LRWSTFDHRGNSLGHAFPRRCACGPPTLCSASRSSDRNLSFFVQAVSQ
jgi:hypothetical protein